MKKLIFILSVMLGLGSHTSEAQILSKIKAAAKKAAAEVSAEIIAEVECAVLDEKCIEKAKKEGKKVVLVQEKNPEVMQQTSGTPDDQNAGGEISGTITNHYESSTTRIMCDNKRNAVYKNADQTLLAASVFVGSREAYCVNGDIQETYDNVSGFQISPDGKHYAYNAYREGTCYLVLDGIETEQIPCDGIGAFDKIKWNNNSSVFAYIKILEKSLTNTRGQLMINGEESPVLDQINKIPFLIIGDEVYYSVVTDGETSLFLNHKPVNPKGITGIQWNVLTNTLVYKITDGTSGEKLVINGKETPAYQQITGHHINRETGVVQYSAEGRNFVSWKDQVHEIPEDESIPRNSYDRFLVNEQSNKLVFFTKNDFYRAYINGKPGRLYQYIADSELSGDGESLFYTAHNAGKGFLVRNEEEIGPYEDFGHIYIGASGNNYFHTAAVTPGKMTYFHNGKDLGIPSISTLFPSPDNRRYVINSHNSHYIDGEEYPGKAGLTSPPLFSPDSKRLAYILENTSRSVEGLILDGKKYKGEILIPNFRSFVFSKDSKHFAFAQQTADNEFRIYIDMKPGPTVGSSQPHLTFCDNNKLHAVVSDAENVYKYEIDLN